MTGREVLERARSLCCELDGHRRPMSSLIARLAVPVAVPFVFGAAATASGCVDDERDVDEGCSDGLDNDGDGDVDCDDEDCSRDEACLAQPTYGVSFEEICDDVVDNDDDGLVDCNDSDCATDPSCFVTTDYAAPFDGE